MLNLLSYVSGIRPGRSRGTGAGWRAASCTGDSGALPQAQGIISGKGRLRESSSNLEEDRAVGPPVASSGLDHAVGRRWDTAAQRERSLPVFASSPTERADLQRIDLLESAGPL